MVACDSQIRAVREVTKAPESERTRMEEKTRDQLLRDLAHYQELHSRATEAAQRKALEELIHLTEAALERAEHLKPSLKE